MEKLILLFIVAVIHFVSASGESFVAEGPSMEPSIHSNDKLVVSKSYDSDHAIQRGDIIVFKVSNDRMFVKRVIALPGETVKVEGDQVYINGAPLREPYLRAVIEGAASKGNSYNVRDYAEHTVPDGCYFVLGDNRSNSSDSRDLGFVKREQIVGKVTSVNGSPLP